jgi:DNA-directed RNA polymerase specialized sigma24 family protein
VETYAYIQTMQQGTHVRDQEVDIGHVAFPGHDSQASADSHEQLLVSHEKHSADALVLDLYQSYRQYRAQAKRYGLTSAEAEEVVHEAFVSLLKHVRTEPTPIRSPKAFMRTVVYHKILEFFQQHHTPTLPLDDCMEAGAPGLSLEAKTHLSVDFQAFARAYPERALALELWASGCTEHELAQALGRTPHAARQYLLECRKRLRAFFKE